MSSSFFFIWFGSLIFWCQLCAFHFQANQKSRFVEVRFQIAQNFHPRHTHTETGQMDFSGKSLLPAFGCIVEK
jgi:hypothetical protein